MGRKWTNITFKIPNKEETVSEASSNPRTREEVIYDFTKEEWSTENIAPDKRVTITFGKAGSSNTKIEKYLEKYFTRFNWIDKAAIIYVTDSAYVGIGYVYKNNNGDAELLEEYQGYVNAEGEDVAGMISDDFSSKPTPLWYW